MTGLNKKKETFKTISKCLIEYDKNLRNKNVMFIVEYRDKSIKKEEVYFPRTSYYHLTGIIMYDKEGKRVNSYKFYNLLKDKRINLNEYTIKNKDKTTELKLQVLPQLMKLDRIANMIGDFENSNLFLQTKKIAGNVNCCMGFVKDSKLKIYVPNTSLKMDIRDITTNRGRIIAIFKKDKNKEFYNEITYLNKNYKLKDILEIKGIKKLIKINDKA